MLLLIQFGFREGFSHVFNCHLFKGNHAFELLKLELGAETKVLQVTCQQERAKQTHRKEQGVSQAGLKRIFTKQRPDLRAAHTGQSELWKLARTQRCSLPGGQQRTW